MGVIPLVRPVAVVVSASVPRWSDEQESDRVLVATVKHAIRHCEGVVSLFLGGNDIENRRRARIVRMISWMFLSRGYRSYSLIEVDAEEDDYPQRCTPLQKECVRMYTAHERTGARFDLVATASQVTIIEDALCFAVRHIRGDREARIPRGVFRCVFLKGTAGETGTYSF